MLNDEKVTVAKKNKKTICPDEIYPNSPLVEVVCEVRFPSELDIECRPYRFENKDRIAGVMLAIDKYAFYVRKYEGHKKFIDEFKRVARILRETYSLQKINRLGWRYINIIPFTRENGIVPLKRFLSVGLKVPEGVSEEFENLNIVFISRVSNGSITTKIETVIREDNRQEALLLDFDFGITQKLSFYRLNALVNAAHEYTRSLFENLITNEYREYLRGDSI